jgi:hypothetical protein
MATVTLEGFTELDAMFKKLGDVPWDVTKAALDQMGEAGEDAVRRTGRSMGVRDPESGVHILDKVTHTKPKQTDDGGFCKVTFSGSRRRGNTTTRNSEIAFINEYGKENQPARPFIRQAGAQYGDQISAPGAKIVGDWMVKTFDEG